MEAEEGLDEVEGEVDEEMGLLVVIEVEVVDDVDVDGVRDLDVAVIVAPKLAGVLTGEVGDVDILTGGELLVVLDEIVDSVEAWGPELRLTVVEYPRGVNEVEKASEVVFNDPLDDSEDVLDWLVLVVMLDDRAAPPEDDIEADKEVAAVVEAARAKLLVIKFVAAGVGCVLFTWAGELVLVKSVLPVVSDGGVVVLADPVDIVWVRLEKVAESMLVVVAVLALDNSLLGLDVVIKLREVEVVVKIGDGSAVLLVIAIIEEVGCVVDSVLSAVVEANDGQDPELRVLEVTVIVEAAVEPGVEDTNELRINDVVFEPKLVVEEAVLD